ncbi:MAG: hypothetical protein GWN01_10100, partial [Nitrosopumilaceae archaeon]|nr:hypothetical protein [Nitrosopumilaceae archaeon]NIX61855.1 hypothetical protein [Nitrosopumilaceae archaeon]
ISLVHDSTFASQLAPETSSLEGYLLPETYFFHWQTREVEIIQHMVSKTLKIFKPDSIQEKLKELTWTRKEV